MNTETLEVVESHPAPPVVSSPAQFSRVELAGVIAVCAVLGWSYAPNFKYLLEAWEQPDYTHGYIVLPVAAWIFWKRWTDPGKDVVFQSWWPGWVVVSVALAARLWFHERGQNWLEAFTMMPVVVGLVLARFGWRMMLKVWPAFAFLLFLYPLPPQINSSLSQPLQSIATTFACALLKFTGLWVMPEGNVILVGNEKLEVAAACNGLSMLMSLAAVVAAAASLFTMSMLKRGALLVSIIPIALGSNILRITATAWCYYKFGSEVGHNYAHDWAGWLMMPTALALVLLELRIISWIVIESSERDAATDRLNLDLISRGTHAAPSGGVVPGPGGVVQP